MRIAHVKTVSAGCGSTWWYTVKVEQTSSNGIFGKFASGKNPDPKDFSKVAGHFPMLPDKPQTWRVLEIIFQE